MPKATVLTDEAPLYYGLHKTHHHHAVNHSQEEYVRHYFIHVNGLEGAWSHFKRQVYGIHHWVSDKHLDQYLGEFTWRYNLRSTEEGARVNAFLGRVGGRLTYKTLIAGQ